MKPKFHNQRQSLDKKIMKKLLPHGKIKEKTFLKQSILNNGKETIFLDNYTVRLQQMRDESNSQLEVRKQRLCELLAQEHEQYKQEVLSMVETPEQVKQRMIEQVQELKQKKETERAAYAQKQYDKQFKTNADELRKIESKFGELQAVAFRNMQMTEKQNILENQYNEEMIYAQLFKRDISKKERIEKDKELKQKQKSDERNQIVSIQQKINEQKREDMYDEIKKERIMLKIEWEKENDRHRQTIQQLKSYKETVNKEIAINNEQQKEMKKQNKQFERIQDKEMILRVLEHEQAIARMEQEVKHKQKEETKQFLLNFKNRANEFNANDKLRDKLIDEENQRQWDRREQVWKQEDDARVKLMFEVYDQRGNNIQHKQFVKKLEQDEKCQDKVEVHKMIEAHERELEEKKKLEQDVQIKIILTKTNLLFQMEEKKARKQLLKDQKQQDEEALKKEMEEYSRRIDNEKAKGKCLLEELRKQRPY